MSKKVEDIPSGSEDSEVSDGSEGWNDVEEDLDNEEESLEVVSLFDDKVFPDAASMLNYTKDKYNFDFVATRDRLGLDFYESIKLVNFSLSPRLHPCILLLLLANVLASSGHRERRKEAA